MIVVFGSLNMDLLMQVPALPLPGETVLSPGYLVKPGGKGNNQAVAAARAGAEVMMVGRVGDDDFGRLLVANLKDNGVSAAGVEVCEEPTGIACICVDPRGHNHITVACGANMKAKALQIPEAALHLGAATVLMQMEVPPEQNWALIAHAHESGALSVLNVAPTAPVPPAALEGLDVLVANEHEIEPLIDALGLARGEPADMARALARETGTICVITLGGKGAVAARGHDLWVVEAMPIDPVDTTGAGDAFTGVLAASLDEAADLPRALHRATVAAGLTCLALGAQESLPAAAAIDAALSRVAMPRRLRPA